MNRIDGIFSQLQARQGRALMPFVCGGHPGPGSTGRLLTALEGAGASIAEVGIPFSDPLADGPVIAAAMHRAIKAGATPQSVLEEVASARASLSIGLVAMVSVSIVHRMGGAPAFVRQAAQAGFDGLIVPDAPLEESGPLIEAGRANGLAVTLLIAPSTPLKRAQEILKVCSGFAYLLARGGITGEQADAPQVGYRVEKLRSVTSLPIAVGFGISSAEHVRAVVRYADAAIVGSAMVRRITEAADAGRDPAAEAGSFCRELTGGLPAPGAAGHIIPGAVQG